MDQYLFMKTIIPTIPARDRTTLYSAAKLKLKLSQRNPKATLLMKKHTPITILNNPNAVPRNSDDT